MSDRRPLPISVASKGSIFAAVQQQQQHVQQMSAAQSANGAGFDQIKPDNGRSFRHQPLPSHINNPATPNSDEYSDPDGSVASIGNNVSIVDWYCCQVDVLSWFSHFVDMLRC